MPQLKRITHRHVQQACERYNKALGLKHPSLGYLQWADIRGDGRYRPALYVQINEGGGVCSSDLRRPTMRQSIAAIDLAIQADKSRDFELIIRATHERGERQRIALREMGKRGLWLSAEQKQQAGLA